MKRVAFVLVLALTSATGFAANPMLRANVKLPDLACKFDPDCAIPAKEKVSNFAVPGANGIGVLRSRRWPVGLPGTPGEGYYVYQYQVDLTNLYSTNNPPCVGEVTIDFGWARHVDFDGDGDLEQYFIVDNGGGSVAPYAVVAGGTRVSFKFSNCLMAGTGPGAGQSSFWFGLATKQSYRTMNAQVKLGAGNVFNLDVYGPLFSPPPAPSMKSQPTKKQVVPQTKDK